MSIKATLRRALPGPYKRAVRARMWVRGITNPAFRFIPLERARSLQELCAWPIFYPRPEFMQFVRRFDREDLRRHYLKQPTEAPEVWANYAVNLWEYEHGVKELTSYPWQLAIPMTDVCNARCTFCSAPLVENPEYLKVEEVKHFAEALRYAVYVNLQGLGEPLAHPQFDAVAAEIKRHMNPAARLEMITNGWLLSGHRWEILKGLNINIIHVSVNAATERTHQIAMGARPGMFQTVVRNIESVLADTSWPRNLKVSMVITRHSLPEVTQFLDMFAAKGVRTFQLNALLPITTEWGFGHTSQYLELWCGNLANAPVLVEEAKQAIARHRLNGVQIFATPKQWISPVDQRPKNQLVQLGSAHSQQPAAGEKLGAQSAQLAAAVVEAEVGAASGKATSNAGSNRHENGTIGSGNSASSGEKASRIYCPMVYNTLSVFQHALNASICCYMQSAPGHKLISIQDKQLSQIVNDPAFQTVRESLLTSDHIPVCDTCPYGDYRA